MALNVFVSFDHSDPKQVEAYDLLKSRTKHILETRNHSVDGALGAGREKAAVCGINDSGSRAIREEITKNFGRCSKLIVLISADTYKNAWIDWEINNFYKMKDAVSPGNAWKSIRGMFLEGCEKVQVPKALECRSTKHLPWDPDTLENWLG